MGGPAPSLRAGSLVGQLLDASGLRIMGDREVATTMILTHIPQAGGHELASPLDAWYH